MRLLLPLFVAIAMAACTRPEREPVLASSAGRPAYALRYADELAATTRVNGEDQQQAQKLEAGFATRADELKKPDWELVRAVVDESDAAGKSADFHDAHGEVDAVRTFWANEKATIDAKVAGGAQYVVKQATCTSGCTNLDVGGPAAFAMNEAIEKQLQKRLRTSNDAFVLVEREHTTLGAQNAAALEKLADDVAQASYLVHVELVLHRERLKRLLADKTATRTTLERFEKDEGAFQSQPGRKDAEKKASDERIAAARKSQAAIDGAVVQAEAAVSAADKTIAAATKDYDTALNALRDKIDQKKKES
jgi:hypothetical protein